MEPGGPTSFNVSNNIFKSPPRIEPWLPLPSIPPSYIPLGSLAVPDKAMCKCGCMSKSLSFLDPFLLLFFACELFLELLEEEDEEIELFVLDLFLPLLLFEAVLLPYVNSPINTLAM